MSKGVQDELKVLRHGAYISILSLACISETPTVLAALKAVKSEIRQKSCDGAVRFTVRLSRKQGFSDVGVCSH